MAKLQSNLDFRLMSLVMRLRDLRLPRSEILREVGIQAGFWVLDFGCGPGSYVAGLSGLVGPARFDPGNRFGGPKRLTPTLLIPCVAPLGAPAASAAAARLRPCKLSCGQ